MIKLDRDIKMIKIENKLIFKKYLTIILKLKVNSKINYNKVLDMLKIKIK
jgi:hypothetical protein